MGEVLQNETKSIILPKHVPISKSRKSENGLKNGLLISSHSCILNQYVYYQHRGSHQKSNFTLQQVHNVKQSLWTLFLNLILSQIMTKSPKQLLYVSCDCETDRTVIDPSLCCSYLVAISNRHKENGLSTTQPIAFTWVCVHACEWAGVWCACAYAYAFQ